MVPPKPRAVNTLHQQERQNNDYHDHDYYNNNNNNKTTFKGRMTSTNQEARL